MSSKKLDFPEINLRMEKILAKIGLKKQKEAAKTLGFSEGYLSQMLTGAVSPSLKILKILHQKSGCNYHWLLTGEGPMFIEQSREEVGRDRFGLYITPKRREIVELLQENQNPGDEDLILGYLRGKKTATVSLAGLQKSLDPSKT